MRQMIAFAFACLTGLVPSLARAQQFAYVSNEFSNTISVYRLNAATGAMIMPISSGKMKRTVVCISKTATTLPPVVAGYMSPYPIVNAVTQAHQTPLMYVVFSR